MPSLIRTPDQRLRVFVSSTLAELAPERAAVRGAVEHLRLIPVMFELGARPHPPRELYRAYLEQSHVFVGIYWQRYGWVAPGETISGLEDEYRQAGERPRLLYVKRPAPEREDRLAMLLADFQADDRASYKYFTDTDELRQFVEDDLALLLSERFEVAGTNTRFNDTDGLVGADLVPSPLTTTIGRERDVDAITESLQGGQRLITITGAGGIGKTRLALEVAQRVGSGLAADVSFVPLAANTEVDGALRAIADKVGARTESATPVDALAAHLRDRQLLLVLDNLEQVDGIGQPVVDLLQRAPALQILATSRQAMRVRGEDEYRIETLRTPNLGDDLPAIAATAAVTLFVDRARSVRRGFEVTESNAPVLGELVRRLDGLPLAIELAAAQLRVLSPERLLKRLSSSLDVLSGVLADLPERQRTLRATLDWSYELLAEHERALFARLSVFAGSWTLDAAEAVCSPDAGALVETLAALLDKSLVSSDQEDAGAEPRFRMLKVVRTYAAQRLDDRGETATYRRRHLVWYCDLAARAQPGLCGPGQREWVARMTPERADLRCAVAAAIKLEDYGAVIELAWDIVVLYFVRDAVHEPDGWLRAVVDARPRLSPVANAKLRSLFAVTRIHHGDYDGVRDGLAGSLATFREEGMEFERAVVLHQLGFVWYHLDHDLDAAVDALEQSSSLFAAIGHDWGVSLASAMLGSVFAAAGDLVRADRCQARALEHARKIDSDQQVVQALGQLALVRLLQERYDEALDLLAEAVPMLQHGGYRNDAANTLDAVAVVAYQRGLLRAAARAVCAANAERAQLRVQPWPTLLPFIERIRRWVQASLGDDAFEEIRLEAVHGDLFQTLRQSVDELTAA